MPLCSAQSNSGAHPGPNPRSHSGAHASANAETHTDAHSYAYSDADANSNPHANADTYSNSHPDAGSDLFEPDCDFGMQQQTSLVRFRQAVQSRCAPPMLYWPRAAMASQLLNLHKTLAWSDFGTGKNLPDPGANTTVETAFTKAHSATSGIFMDPVGKAYKLRDSIVVTIVFDKPTADPNDTSTAGSWVASWVSQKPQSYQDSLLVHEQGHYDITALLSRDYYNALLAQRGKTFASVSDAQTALQTVLQNADAVSQPTSDRYDADTVKGTDAAQQAKWSGYISTAFAGSGTFLSVLSQNGITISP